MIYGQVDIVRDLYILLLCTRYWHYKIRRFGVQGIIGFDVVEVAPSLDDSKIALFAARKIIIECWGHHYRKITGKR